MTATTITAAGRKPQVLDALGRQRLPHHPRGPRRRRADPRRRHGHDQVVLISGKDPHRLQQHRAVIDAARAADVQHVYYTSGVRADDPSFALGADHKATEDAIKQSGLRYTILRNGWYIENYIPAMQGA